jgi:pyruvate kinase
VVPVAGGDELDRVGWAVAHAAVLAAEDLRVAAILCPTRTGTTARRVAAFRPSMPIVGLSSEPTVLRQLCLLRSVHPRMLEPCADTETQTRLAVRTARGTPLVRRGDLVAVVSGAPGRGRGHTDTVHIVRA